MGFIPRTGAEVGANVGFGANAIDVIEKFVSAEAVVFDGAPGHFEAAGTFVAGADAIAPVVIRRKIAAGPAEERDVEALDGFEDVLAKAGGIGERIAFVEDAAGDAATEVFDEVAVELGIDLADLAIGVDFDAGGLRGSLAATEESGRGGGDEAGGEGAPGEDGIWGGHGSAFIRVCVRVGVVKMFGHD